MRWKTAVALLCKLWAVHSALLWDAFHSLMWYFLTLGLGFCCVQLSRARVKTPGFNTLQNSHGRGELEPLPRLLMAPWMPPQSIQLYAFKK